MSVPISIQNACLWRENKHNKFIVRNIDWIINDVFEHWVILGPNGSGKSSLMALLWGQNWLSSGVMQIFGKEYGKEKTENIRQSIAFYQESYMQDFLLHHSQILARQIVLGGYKGGLRAPYLEVPKTAFKKLERLLSLEYIKEMKFILDKKYTHLSSGEKARVLLMRLFMNEPKLILLDECYNSLDMNARIQFDQSLLSYIKEKPSATVHILHRIEEIPSFATHILLLKEGEILKSGSIDAVLKKEHLSELYDRELDIIKRGDRFYCLL